MSVDDPKENDELDIKADSNNKKPPRDTDCHEMAKNGKGIFPAIRAEDTGVEPATHCWAIDFESTC